MKKLIFSLSLTVLMGCAVFGPPTARSFLTKTALSVDAAMKNWGAYVILNQVPDEKQKGVKMAYSYYQASFATATNAYWASVMQNNPALFTTASNNLIGAKNSLITSTLH